MDCLDEQGMIIILNTSSIVCVSRRADTGLRSLIVIEVPPVVCALAFTLCIHPLSFIICARAISQAHTRIICIRYDLVRYCL